MSLLTSCFVHFWTRLSATRAFNLEPANTKITLESSSRGGNLVEPPMPKLVEFEKESPNVSIASRDQRVQPLFWCMRLVFIPAFGVRDPCPVAK